MTQTELQTEFEGIKVISIVGQNPIKVPAGMIVERALQVMRINLDTYERQVEGDTLILSARAGTKGARPSRTVSGAFAIPRFQILPNGRLAPVSPIDPNTTATFPTNADIAIIAELFPNDDLFITLTDLTKLQEYYTAVVAYKKQLAERSVDELQSQLAVNAKDLADRIRNRLGLVVFAASRVGNEWQADAAEALAEVADRLYVIHASIEEALITEELEAQEESRREALRNDALERIKAENPELDI